MIVQQSKTTGRSESGARPILNTTQGGTHAGVGVFGSNQNVGYAVTVYNDGGGNKYYIDGVKQATLTGLIRGATYTFDQSDSTNGTHPLVFGTTAEGNNFNKTATTGASAGSAGAAVPSLFHMMDLIRFTIIVVLTLGWVATSQVSPQMRS